MDERPKILTKELIHRIQTEMARGVGYVDTFKMITSEFAVTQQTFNKHWKDVKKAMKEAQHRDIMEWANDEARNKVEAFKEAIMEKYERMAIASGIARDTNAANKDRIAALVYLSKIDGDFAESKLQIKHTVPTTETYVIGEPEPEHQQTEDIEYEEE